LNLVDSSGWLEYLADGKNAKVFAPVIENTEKLIVSAINIYEVFKKVCIEKDESSAIQIVALMQQAKVIDVNQQIAIQAAKLSCELKIPMADSIIYTTAIANNATLWTQDADFINLKGVKYYKK